MDSSRFQQQLLRRTAENLTRLGRAQAWFTAREGDPPRPGDLFVFPATADFELQWAVLERHPRDDERLLVVPADLDPQVGSTDVAVPPGAPYGAMTLRCRFGVWLRKEAFETEMRTGFLPSADLERARLKRAEIDRGAVYGSALERQTDVEPEYQDLAEEVLAGAQDALSKLDPPPAALAEHEDGAEHGSFFAGGVYGHTGDYPGPPADAAEVAGWARREDIDPGLLRLLEHVHAVTDEIHLGLPGGVDPRDPKQAGWAVVFHAGESSEVREALAPLVEHRRHEIGGRTKVLEYRSGEDAFDWLARHGVGADEVQPAKVPHYLLLVGPPTRISYEFQLVLAVRYAVGRLAFDEPADYRRYAESLIEAETGTEPPTSGEAVFFAPRHASDRLTRLTADELVRPLAEAIPAARHLTADAATRDRLSRVFQEGHDEESRPPALVFCAGHGLVWPEGHAEQSARQGDLVCQDWTGPGRLESRHTFGAGDLTDEARLHGTMAFFFASYSAGTPRRDLSRSVAPALAGEPLVARLPGRLLAHPRGGALAVVGLLGRTWSSASASTAAKEMLRALREVVRELLAGTPAGHAVHRLHERYAVLTTDLKDTLTKIGFGAKVDEGEVAAAWIGRQDLRGFVVLGDPAARLRSGE